MRSIVVMSVALAMTLAACGRRRTLPDNSRPLPVMKIAIKADDDLNSRRPLHAVVRKVTFKKFVEDSYASVAALVVQPDESVLTKFVIYPGGVRDVFIDLPKEGPIAIYFLFSDANGTSWKRFYEEVPRSIAVDLGKDRILEPERCIGMDCIRPGRDLKWPPPAAVEQPPDHDS